MESDELGQLMPNLQHLAGEQGSPGNTAALRQYIRVLGEKHDNVPPAFVAQQKPRTDGLQPRAGSGRRPQRRYFTIKWRVEEPAVEEQPEEAQLDPEALKDALLEQARAQRHALVAAALRPGTGRVPRARGFAIALPSLQPEEEVAEEQLEAEFEQVVAAQEDPQWGPGFGTEQGCEAEEGVLAEQQWQTAPRPADAGADALPPGASTTPAAALLERDGSEPVSTSGEEERADSQWARAKTPASSLFGRYTPMEGVPERLALLATRIKQPPAAAVASGGQGAVAATAGTPTGFTPLEGIPERLLAYQAGPRFACLPGATLVCSNKAQPSVDSPVEGLVQHAAQRGADGGAAPRPAKAGGFAGFELLSPAQQEQQEEARWEAEQQQEQPGGGNDDDDDDYGFVDDGGYDVQELSGDEVAACAGLSGKATFDAGQQPADLADGWAQTGASLEAAGEEGAAAGGSPPLPAAEADDFDGMHAYEQGPGMDDADLPAPSAAAPNRVPRKPNQNPGSRLRNEHKRKSLAVAGVGRGEILNGVRRSSRSKQEPLKWWLNEKLEFGRRHMTMPTVQNVVHKVPNTPWQTVADYKRPSKKQRQRAPTPHDLGGAMAATDGAAAGEEQAGTDAEEAAESQRIEVEQQAQREAEEEVPEEEQGCNRRTSPGRRRQAGGRRGRAASAKAPAAKAKPTKTKGAGTSRRKGRR